jgi:hypothetical protein
MPKRGNSFAQLTAHFRVKVDSGVPKRGLGGGFKPPSKFRSFDKTEPNSLFRGKYIRNNLMRTRVLLICKLSGTPD